jgi:hypothetical protein
MIEKNRVVKVVTVSSSAVREALEILKAIDDYFNEGRALNAINAQALLFGDERTLREHISQAVKDLQEWI